MAEIEKSAADKAYEEFASNPVLRKLGAHVDRASFVAGYDACTQCLEAALPAVVEALKNCTDDLEAEVEARYGEAKNHPAMRIRYERDMETVQAARQALSLLEKKI